MFCNHQLELHYSTSQAFFSLYRCAHQHAMRCQPEDLLHLGLTTETKLVRLYHCFTQLTALKRSPSASVKHLFRPRDSTGVGKPGEKLRMQPIPERSFGIVTQGCHLQIHWVTFIHVWSR